MLSLINRTNMDGETSGSQTITEKPFEVLLRAKRKACEELSLLTQTISSVSSKRSKICLESFSTYKTLVKSYKLDLWAGNEISPRELAVHGWKCTAKNQVQCIACKQFLCTAMPKITDVDVDVYNRCLRRIRERILGSHVLTCLYRSKPIEFKHDVDESFLNNVLWPRISTYNMDGLVLNMTIPDDVVKYIKETKFSPSQEAVVAASLGWSVEIESIVGQKQFVAVCEYCAKNFILGHIAFDPIKTHRRWCPVLDVNEDSDIPLWTIIYRRITPAVQNTSSPVTTKEIERAKRTLDRSLSVIAR
ncbi:C3HC zinc finger-like protein [Dictyocaulus viviparus]|uniref:C3HC zinc finger-like protein n=1 Tax=Dictyocaulus viviparus TaxID=29172 RepID=A0A0D8XGW6_DICVI|nr:C3HC zinc finger-like protein [Dictyocaulus viviparus]